MSSQRISDAVREATDTAQVTIGEGVLHAATAALFRESFGERQAIVIADENTFAAAGEVVEECLQDTTGGTREPHVFGARPVLHAQSEPIDELAAALSEHDAIPVAVGSGTINDIVKRASHLAQRPYMCVVTAASVDGYTAFGASITKDGYKQTMECPAPHAVLADVSVLQGAPAPMTSAGYADLLAKVSAGADWIVADALEVEPIDDTAWSLVQGPLREATFRPGELHGRNPGALEALIEGLIMSGLAMQAAASSRPASGAEHQFSHLWEMEGLGEDPDGSEPPLSHGFKVGLGTLSSAALYERLLARDLSALDVDAVAGAWPSWSETERDVRAADLPQGAKDAAIEQTRAKYVDADQLATRVALVRERWPELTERLREQLSAAAALRDQLAAAGCPITPAEIGLSSERLRSTYRRARLIRSRYTVLDLAAETGLLDECVGELFSAGGFWSAAAG
ncbi:MAG: sn-glycerol-1-phosphate dehydrogenase [Solirubrobacteraceae bacterium]